MLKRTIFFLLIVFIQKFVVAQDPYFSQFYNSPVYLNPALTGTGQNNGRFAMTAKVQWLRLNNPMKYVTASIDKTLFHPSGDPLMSAGLMVNYFSEGYLRNTTFSLPLAKSFGGNVNGECEDWFFSLGLQPGVTIGSVNRDKFLFIDQIDASGPTGAASNVEGFQNNGQRTHFTMSAGGIFCYGDWMAGIAVHNLNEPADGVIGTPDESKIPRRYTAHLSYILSSEYLSIKPTLIYQQQGASTMLTAGALFDWEDSRLSLSLWYRDNRGATSNSLSVGAILKLGSRTKLANGSTENVSRLGVSYEAEFTSPAVKTSYGSSELGFMTDFNTSRDIECPRTSGICNIRFPWEFF